MPVKVRGVDPIYPPIAVSARREGTVVIEARIGEDGRVTNARVVRSIPLLNQAALDAVTQWEFAPTLISGQAVPVIASVAVSFDLRSVLGDPPAR